MTELSIKEAISCWLSEGRRMAGASIVTKNGSSPHLAGLAVVVNELGQLAGAFSGGCVDGEILLACEQVLKTNQPQRLQFGPNESLFAAANLVCGGKIDVWVYELGREMIEALSSMPNKHCALSINWSDGHQRIQQAVVDKQTALTITKCSPKNELITSTSQVDRAARFLLYEQQNTCFTLLPTGEQEFIERIGHRELLLIVGESGFTDRLCRLARMLDFEVVVCEPRRRFAESIISADEVDRRWPNECIKELTDARRLTSTSVIIVCTHDPKFDEPALLAAIQSPVGFIGALGSRRTIADRRTRLLAAGLSELDIARIRSPLGLDLGAETAAQTAVSVFAEIIAFKNNRSAKPLTELSGKIHG